MCGSPCTGWAVVSIGKLARAGSRADISEPKVGDCVGAILGQFAGVPVTLTLTVGILVDKTGLSRTNSFSAVLGASVSVPSAAAVGAEEAVAAEEDAGGRD